MRQEEARKAEETRKKAELERQRQEKLREEERLKAEIERKQRELKEAEARKAEEARKKAEAQKQLEEQQRKVQQVSQPAAQLYKRGKKYYDARNYAEAFMYFLPAAEQGHAEAQFQLGVMYRWGNGVCPNPMESKKWYRKAFEAYCRAAEQGNADAQYWLGEMYRDGEVVFPNKSEAVEMVSQSRRTGTRFGTVCRTLDIIERHNSNNYRLPQNFSGVIFLTSHKNIH